RSKRSKTNSFSLDMLLFKWCLWVVPTALKPKESIVSLITHLYSLDFCFYFFTFPCNNGHGKLAPTNVAFKKKNTKPSQAFLPLTLSRLVPATLTKNVKTII